MKIGLNGQNLFTTYPAGPERYTYKLYRYLAEIDKDNIYTIYLTKKPDDDEWKQLTGKNKNFNYKVIEKVFSWTQISLAFELIFHRVDLFFSPVHTLPGLAQIILFKTKFICMIHGLEYLVNEIYVNIAKQAIHKPIVLNWIVNTSDMIIVPSGSTKNDLLKMYPKVKNKIIIIREGVDREFYKRNYDEVIKVKEKYNIDQHDEYLFFVSTIQPRKNIPNLVRGFAKFINENEKFKGLKLVIAGKEGWNYEKSLAAPETYGVADNVIFIGRVEDADLPPLFSGCKAFINMSLDEGFSLTVLEAMACSCPLIISDIKAHHEIAGSYGNYANPKDYTDIAETIKKVLEQNDFNKIESALYAARTYTWINTAKETLDIFESVVFGNAK